MTRKVGRLSLFRCVLVALCAGGTAACGESGPGPCGDTGYCAATTVLSVAYLGQMFWTITDDTQSLPLSADPSGSYAPLGTCRGRLVNTGFELEPTELYAELACTATASNAFHMGVTLPDLRQTAVQASWTASMGGSYGPPCDGPCSQAPCMLYAHNEVGVAIESATGGESDEPPFVEPEFQRVVRLSFDVSGRDPRCESIRIGGEIRFRLKSADFHYDPRAPCPCPM